MPMSKPGLCCDKCFEMIARRHTASAKLWLDLCELQLYSHVFAIKSQDFEMLRLLEVLGFIVTTDTPDYIIVKVKGKKYDGKGAFFCTGQCGWREDQEMHEM